MLLYGIMNMLSSKEGKKLQEYVKKTLQLTSDPPAEAQKNLADG